MFAPIRFFLVLYLTGITIASLKIYYGIWVQTLKVITLCSTKMLSAHCKNVQTSNNLL